MTLLTLLRSLEVVEEKVERWCDLTHSASSVGEGGGVEGGGSV